jgi:serine/threonine protein kinase
MALVPGTRLGSLEILDAAGAGGMGEVCRARDTRLERTVAIKVLPEQFSRNPDLKLRREREAKAISALNHPHICTPYDIGHQERCRLLRACFKNRSGRSGDPHKCLEIRFQRCRGIKLVNI